MRSTLRFRKVRGRCMLLHIVIAVEHLHCLRNVEGFFRVRLFERGYYGILFTTARSKNKHGREQRRIILSSQGRALTSKAEDTITSPCLPPRFGSVPDLFYNGRSQKKTHLLRLEFFSLRSPLDRARSVLTYRAMCSVAGQCDPVVSRTLDLTPLRDLTGCSQVWRILRLFNTISSLLPIEIQRSPANLG